MGCFLLAVSVLFILLPMGLISGLMELTVDPIITVIHESPFLNQVGWIPRLLLNVICFCLITTCSFGTFRLLFLILVLFVTAARMIENSLQLIDDRLKRVNVKWKPSDLMWNIKCYNTLIICMNMSQFVELVAMVLMATGMVLLVIFNFITIRLYNFFPFLIWCYFPFINVIIVCAIQMVVPRSVVIAQSSNTFVQYMKLRGKLCESRYVAKRMHAFIPFRVNAGYIFFYFKKSTK